MDPNHLCFNNPGNFGEHKRLRIATYPIFKKKTKNWDQPNLPLICQESTQDPNTSCHAETHIINHILIQNN